VPSRWTDADVVGRTTALFRAAGHTPIVMTREIDGFVVNRLQGALLEEAFRLVAEGLATTEDVDVALRDGLALRWSFMGPFETIDLNAPAGVRDYAERYQQIYARIFPSAQWRADWSGPMMEGIEAERRVRLPADLLGERAAWRDRRLMALAAHKRRASEEIGD
jgi:L-gulonate 3-dehydrogenase